MKTIKRLLAFIASAYVLLFFSEYFFVNEEPAFSLIEILHSDIPGIWSLLELILVYTFFSYALLIAIQYFNVHTIWGLMLAGALFGWWTEGTIIPVIYEAIPITIFWPSVGWHALIDVLIGWYLFRQILKMNKWYLTVIISIALGSFWGIWATWFWADGGFQIQPNHFIMFTFFTSVLLIGAYWIMDQYSFASLKISKAEVIFFVIISIIFLVLLSYGYGILPWIVLVPLTGLTLFALHRGRNNNSSSSLFLDTKTLLWQYPVLLLIPFFSSVVYYFIYKSGWSPEIGETLPIILMILGFIAYCIALYRNIVQTNSLDSGD